MFERNVCKKLDEIGFKVQPLENRDIIYWTCFEELFLVP